MAGHPSLSTQVSPSEMDDNGSSLIEPISSASTDTQASADLDPGPSLPLNSGPESTDLQATDSSIPNIGNPTPSPPNIPTPPFAPFTSTGTVQDGGHFTNAASTPLPNSDDALSDDPGKTRTSSSPTAGKSFVNITVGLRISMADLNTLLSS